ncbi:MAG: GAF domain-containing protein [Spirochaetia bacterium]
MSRHDPLSFLEESLTFRSSREEMLRNIKLIIRVRWILTPSIFIILFISSLIGVSRLSAFSGDQLIVNGLNLVIVLFMNLIYLLLVRKIENPRPLIIFQLLIDIIYFSLTVYKTGDITSPFVFLFFIAVFEASILISGKSAYLIAMVCSFLYSGIVFGVYTELFPHQDFFSPLGGLQENQSYFFLMWFFSIFSFFAFAALTAYFSDKLHTRQMNLEDANNSLVEKNRSLLFLYATFGTMGEFEETGNLAEYILGELLDHLSLDRALLYLRKENELILFKVKERKKSEAVPSISIPLKKEAGLTARAAVLQESYNITDPYSSPLINRKLAGKIGMNPFALSPLVFRSETIGVLGIDRSGTNGAITEDEFRMLKLFADQAAIMITAIPGQHLV